MTRLGLSATSPASRSTSPGNMVRRNSSAKNVPKSMRFNPTGKPTRRPVVLESINVTAALFFQGVTVSSLIGHSAMPWPKRAQDKHPRPRAALAPIYMETPAARRWALLKCSKTKSTSNHPAIY